MTITPTVIPVGSPSTRRRAADVIRFEWTKLRTVASTWWILVSVAVATIAIGTVVSYATVAQWHTLTPAERATLDPVFRGLTGLFFGQLAVGVLGVLAVTAEYSTGMIRSTLAAVPNRRAVLAGKALTVAVPVFVVSTAAVLVAFAVSQAVFATKNAGVSIGSPGALRAVIGGGLYLTALALLGVGLGAVIRHTAGAISAFVGLVLVVPTITGFLPSPWGRDISKFMPADAGQSLLSLHTNANSLSPWAGFAVLCGWTALALGAAAVLITRRDA
jgi:hypothetical protein